VTATIGMRTTLVLLRYDPRTRSWKRAGHPVVFDAARGSGEAEATAFGEAWRGEGSNERRRYTLLTDTKSFDGER
jgi:hypothetical protein